MDEPATSPKPTGLGVVAVYVDDLDAALGFYCGLLGFEVSGEMPPGKMIALGDLKLYVEPGRSRRSTDMAAAETSMVLLSDAVLELRAQLEAAGAALVGEPMGDGATFAMFRVADPAGNLVEIAGKP